MMTNTAWRRQGKFSAKLIGGLGALALAGTLVACAGASAPEGSGGDTDAPAEMTTVRLEYNVGTSTLPIVVADRQGFFADHGVDFKGTEIAPGPAGMAALAQGQSDVLQTTFQTVLEAADQGLDLKAFTGMGLSTTDQPSFPVFTNDESVSDFGDLSGKTVGVPALTSFATSALEYLVAQEGGEAPAELVVVPWDTQADQLGANRVAAVWSINPHARNLSSLGFDMIGDPTLIVTDQQQMVASLLVTTGDFAAAHPEALAGIAAALTDAVEWIAANDDDAKQLLIEWIGLPENLVIGYPMTQFQIELSEADLSPEFTFHNELGKFTNLKLSDLYVDVSG